MADLTHSYETPFGLVHIHSDSVTVEGDIWHFGLWANRPGAAWPCSTLDRFDSGVLASFDSSGLIDLEGNPDDIAGLDSSEFNAWIGDVLRSVLPADHPAYFVTVGQFEAAA